MISVVPKPQRIRLLSKKQYLYKPADIQRYIEEGHGKEGYRLLIDNDGIKIFCETDEGAFRAETTLKQLYVEKKRPISRYGTSRGFNTGDICWTR